MFFPEEDSTKADALLSQFENGKLEILVPSFMTLEFVNVLWLRVREKRSTSAECANALSRFQDLVGKMYVIAMEPFLEPLLRNCMASDHPAYDLAFVVLSEQFGVPFITADANLYRKVARHSRSVALLRDM